jgi:hypothetical protein
MIFETRLINNLSTELRKELENDNRLGFGFGVVVGFIFCLFIISFL